ncbi:hypothetical protein [Blastopirellula marina]|uniref:Uncharacterized protein n=1 Tax=Blastopirellula marina TaxID=124 RepID=A0A2S8GTQ6_9BACT|nr:hypothetical protein [Blastopirellula marina]PQO47792.1 hypothetical protein C5Y93_01750 [Blastopirellula marina]
MPTKTFTLATLVVVAFLTAATTLPSLIAQETADESKPSVRLPAYYGDVITADQRKKIYAIQRGYAPKIEQLEAEIKKLEEAMEAEMEGVLTQPQIDRIKELIEEEKIRREKNEAAKRAAEKAAADSGS